MDLKLTIIGGKANKSQVTVELPSVIGRSREADLTVAHPMISRKHCELYEVNGLVMVRDLGSLNGLFVGGRQVNEAALHPNAEFTIGPLTFRVEYEYAGEIVSEPDATTVTDGLEASEPAAEPETGDFEVVDQPEAAAQAAGPRPDQQAPAFQEEVGVESGTPQAADAPPTIAPPDGQLPDFSAWGVQDAGADQPEAQAPLPPPPAFFAEGPPPEPEDGAAERREGQTPEAATSAGPAATESFPETAAFEPGELAELEQTHHAADDLGEADQAQETAGAEAAEPEAPPTERSAGAAADEETKESDVAPAPPAEQAAEEGMFDLSAPPAAEAEESGEAGTGDKELDDFLQGLE